MKNEFVHCHVHSEFSLLDGASKVKDIIKTARANDMSAIALTDHNVMYGTISFYKESQNEKNGAKIKPLIGYEAYVATNGHLEKSSKEKYNLVLLAQNNKGYKNIIKLVSTGFVDGFYYEPRIDNELLEKYNEGVIVLSSCLNGEIASSLLRGNYDRARNVARKYKEIFGDNYYLEVQDHAMMHQRKINPMIVSLAKELDIKIVATNDTHYTKKDDALAREILTCIKNGIKIEDNKNRLEGSEHYLKSADEMFQVFHEIPQALKSTLEIAEKCHVSFKFNDYKDAMPDFPLPAGYNADQYLNKLALEGLRRKYKEITPQVTKRFHYEIDMISKMKFAEYFLIVADYTGYARSKGIQVGPGRGSAAGSIVAYTMGITDIDPLPYNLLFERFLNPERVSMPDVDTDFCIDRRDEVIQYVTEKYGKTNVSQIVTLGTLGAKQVIRDVSKVMGYTVSDSEKLSKMIPKEVGMKLKDAMKEGSELYNACEENPNTKNIVNLAMKLEGLARHSSVHAAGVVISKYPLDTVVPVEKSKDGTLIAQYQMTELESLGLLKMDFLGLRNLTMISSALDIIERNKGFKLNLDEITFDDLKTYELLSSGNTVGVFQLESSGMQNLVLRLEPSVFEEIIALIALYRPGPLGSGMVDDFVERKHGRQEIEYAHPSIEPVLKDTYGLVVYQEQIMQISQIMANYTLGQADLLRRAMGKKDLEKMAQQRTVFSEGAAKNGINSDIATKMFDVMEKFAEYGFNKSHSAAYAVITYRTAYLKANYTIEYMAALISSVMNNPDKVPMYTSESKRMGIKILQPDVNSSENGFSVDETSIRFGLKAVKGVGENVINSIVESRKKSGTFKSLYDFCKRINSSVLNKKAIESLIKAGAFDSINKNRKQLLENQELVSSSAFKKQLEELSGQTSLFGGASIDDDNDFDESPQMTEVEPFQEEEALNIEKQVLGLYVSGHPLEKYRSQIERFSSVSLSHKSEIEDGTSITVGGMINGIRPITTKKGDIMAVFTIEDLTGSIEVVAYPESYGKNSEMLKNDMKVLLHGKLNVKEDDTKIILSSLNILSEIPYLEIKLLSDTSMIKLVSMRSLLQEVPGDTPIILNYSDSNVEVVAGKDYWISPNEEVVNKLRLMFSYDSVKLVC